MELISLSNFNQIVTLLKWDIGDKYSTNPTFLPQFLKSSASLQQLPVGLQETLNSLHILLLNWFTSYKIVYRLILNVLIHWDQEKNRSKDLFWIRWGGKMRLDCLIRFLRDASVHQSHFIPTQMKNSVLELPEWTI